MVVQECCRDLHMASAMTSCLLTGGVLLHVESVCVGSTIFLRTGSKKKRREL